MSAPPVCLIFNPASGRRRAARRLEQVAPLWPEQAELRATGYLGHAAVLAEEAVQQGFRRVGAAGGDGTVHEVANGLLRTGRDDVTLVVAPLGSANDYAWSLKQEFGGAGHPGPLRAQVDVGRIRDDRGREKWFVCNLGIGLNGLVTVESRRIGWLQGPALYGLAALRVILFRLRPQEWSLQWDGVAGDPQPALMLSLMLGRREGNFVIGPQASLCDGLFDGVLVRPMSRLKLLRHLLRLARRGLPQSDPLLEQRRCRSLRLTSRESLCIHTDGEVFCAPADGVKSVEIELTAGRLAVELWQPLDVDSAPPPVPT
jgi:diacylglycerol kinase family enzyme